MLCKSRSLLRYALDISRAVLYVLGRTFLYPIALHGITLTGTWVRGHSPSTFYLTVMYHSNSTAPCR